MKWRAMLLAAPSISAVLSDSRLESIPLEQLENQIIDAIACVLQTILYKL